MNHNIEKSLVQNYLAAQKNCGKNNNITVFDWGKRNHIGSELGFYFIHLNEKEGSGSHSHHNESKEYYSDRHSTLHAGPLPQMEHQK